MNMMQKLSEMRQGPAVAMKRPARRPRPMPARPPRPPMGGPRPMPRVPDTSQRAQQIRTALERLR